MTEKIEKETTMKLYYKMNNIIYNHSLELGTSTELLNKHYSLNKEWTKTKGISLVYFISTKIIFYSDESLSHQVSKEDIVDLLEGKHLSVNVI